MSQFSELIQFITSSIGCFRKLLSYHGFLKPGFHLQQTPRPRHKTQSDYVIERSSFALIALFWLEIGRCCGRNWPYGNQALQYIYVTILNSTAVMLTKIKLRLKPHQHDTQLDSKYISDLNWRICTFVNTA